MPRPLPLEPGPELTVAEFARYSRQLVLPEFGIEGQRRLRAAKVLVLGAGGLGSPALLYLAAAGVGTIGIVDFDAVEESNLHRQVIHATAALGQPKVASAVAAIAGLNPGVTAVPHQTRLTGQNAADLFAGYDLILDGTDNFPTRYLANDTCVALGIPLVWASVLGFAAQVAVFWPAGGGPQLRDLFPSPPEPGTVPNCAEAGVIGALCGQVGSLMATEAIKLLTGIGDPLLGRVLVIDALAGRWDELPLRAASPHAAPGQTPGSPPRLLDAPNPVPAGTFAPAASELPAGSEDVLLLDVREPAEFAESHLAGSLNVPLGAVLAGAEIPADRPVLVICRSGARADIAAAALTARGHDARVLRGGLLGLTSAG
ncbi:MAG: molybdopterin-synthase adenylyltransferase MoeB [Propionicimonas sp.]|nr:molybdopterin-synthase adenylyltransferase MoeB [Propionicimonas sp.]